MRRRHVPGEPEPPSKGELKRRAQVAQELGQQLIEAPDALLDALPLPDRLVEAVREARRITSHSALLRQRLFIGKLIRGLDAEPIRAALAARAQARRRDTVAFRRIESWRDRLLLEGEAAFAALLEECPRADLPELSRLLGEARRELGSGGPPRARRQLFRTLRGMMETASGAAAGGARPTVPHATIKR